MKHPAPLLAVIVSMAFSSCVKICDVGPIKSTAEGITFGKSQFPCYKQNDFTKAVELTIQAIYSKEFETQLEDHIRNKIGTGAHVDAWKNVTTHDVVTSMRSEINGKYVDTYGGIAGWWKYLRYGNLAYDGTLTGPIRINRAPLKGRSATSLSGTIAHEVAHRIGLTHPHSDINLSIAKKEPAYVVGDIIEAITEAREQATN